ncbi:MAG: hypothetical protein GX465_14550 [Acidobacteria bacterium]|nr:hypothetical protein [Acidobacteriota bacterium]
MKRYFRYTIEWNRETASEVVEMDVDDNISEDELKSHVSDAMWNNIINNNIDSWSEEITKEEYEEDQGM